MSVSITIRKRILHNLFYSRFIVTKMMSMLLKNCVALTTNGVKTKNSIFLVFANTKSLHTSSSLCKENESNAQMSLDISVIGVPNAGKSTFINGLIHHRVCPTSTKVHTTREANKVIYTTGNTQLVFYDTPGLVTQKEINKHNLEQSFKSSYRHAIQHSDMIAVLHDVSNSWTRNELHSTVLDTLKAYPEVPSFIVLNKIDTLKSKRILLDLVRKLTNDSLSNKKIKKNEEKEHDPRLSDLKTRQTGWSNFSDIFMVSSILGDGLSEILSYLLQRAKPRPFKYPSNIFTDEPVINLIVNSVRARLLDYLPQEIPYNLESQMEYYSEEKNTIFASVQVVCPTERIERLICGQGNGKLKQITERVTSDLVETFGKPISLTISTIPKKITQRRS